MKLINLIPILKKLPKDTILWCDLFGNFTVDEVLIGNSIDEHSLNIIITKPLRIYRLTKYGQSPESNEELPCILWPSKDKRTVKDWIELDKSLNK